MREKLLSLMRSEGLTSSRLAELLGIQPSGISHILSGRNKPSFDFVQKILRRFPTINPDWLLLDQGPMYRDTADSAADANSQATQSVPQLFADTPQNYDTSAPPSDGNCTCRFRLPLFPERQKEPESLALPDPFPVVCPDILPHRPCRNDKKEIRTPESVRIRRVWWSGSNLKRIFYAKL